MTAEAVEKVLAEMVTVTWIGTTNCIYPHPWQIHMGAWFVHETFDAESANNWVEHVKGELRPFVERLYAAGQNAALGIHSVTCAVCGRGAVRSPTLREAGWTVRVGVGGEVWTCPECSPDTVCCVGCDAQVHCVHPEDAVRKAGWQHLHEGWACPECSAVDWLEGGV